MVGQRREKVKRQMRGMKVAIERNIVHNASNTTMGPTSEELGAGKAREPI